MKLDELFPAAVIGNALSSLIGRSDVMLPQTVLRYSSNE